MTIHSGQPVSPLPPVGGQPNRIAPQRSWRRQRGRDRRVRYLRDDVEATLGRRLVIGARR